MRITITKRFTRFLLVSRQHRQQFLFADDGNAERRRLVQL